MAFEVTIKAIIIVSVLFSSSSCTDKVLEEELDTWCNCIQEHQPNGQGDPECQELMIEMSKKYEYDPGAVEIIQKRAAECR